jgi:membrane fusion protein, multidrug efflux system
MKRYLWLVLILMLVGGIIGYRELSSDIGKKPERRSAVSREIPVKLAAVKTGPIAYILNTSGDVQATRQVDVVSRISGYVEQVRFEIGDRVKEGEVVAVVQPKEQIHRVEEDEANLKIAQATLQEKESQLADAEKQVERARQLRQKEFISTQELDQAETRANMSRAQRDLARAQLAQREATLAQSRYLLSLTQLTAPFNGMVTRRLLDPGALVSSATPILTLAVPDPLKVVVNVPERDVNLVRVGMIARVRVDAFPDRSFEGKIVRLNSALDPASRTLAAEVHVPNSERLLKPGMFARVSVVLAEEENSLLVPSEAVVEEEGQNYIYGVSEGKAKRKAVTLGWTQNSYIAITQGLEKDEKIVIAGQHRLKQGSKVRVLEESGQESPADDQPAEKKRKGNRKRKADS